MHDPGVERWLDAFFDALYARQPVDATFIGVHTHDHRLPDESENGAGDALAVLQDLLRRAPAMTDIADPIRALDVRLAVGHLRLQIAEYESTHFHRGNPARYTGEAVFGVLSLLLGSATPLAERVSAATERLAKTSAWLTQGRHNVRGAPPSWTDRALRECEGALALLADMTRMLPGTWRDGGLASGAVDRFSAAAGQAAHAFREYGHWLETGLRSRPSGAEGCGPALLARCLREGHGLDADAGEIEAIASDELTAARRELAAAVRKAGVRDEAEAMARLAALHPPVGGYYARYGEIRDQVQRIAEEHELVSWPDDPIRFVPRPAWVRAAAPHLYFLFYRSPAAFDRPEVHESLVTPIDGDMPAGEQTGLLRATNDSVIRLNHVIHHGAIGHHVQNGHAYRSASRIGRVAAIDGASRIAMLCGGTMAEGWACYATDLMDEAGALSPLERVAHRRSIVRLCARAIVDVRLHEGRLSVAGAASFYVTEAGMERSAAFNEAVKNSMFPATALMYLMGRKAIHELRDRLRERPGTHFDARAFHDALLSCGSVPVTHVAAKLLRSPPDEGARDAAADLERR